MPCSQTFGPPRPFIFMVRGNWRLGYGHCDVRTAIWSSLTYIRSIFEPYLRATATLLVASNIYHGASTKRVPPSTGLTTDALYPLT